MFCHSCVAYKKFYEAKWTNIPYSKNKLYIWSVIFLSSFWISEYSYETWRQLENCNCQWHSQWSGGLESTDAAPEVPHPRPTRLPSRRTVSAFFFFFSRIRTDLARFASMRLDSCWIGFDSRWTGLIRPKSGRIGHIGSYQPTAETGQKTAETGRNTPETAEIGLEYGRKSRNLHSSFFFCESRHSMCFLRIF